MPLPTVRRNFPEGWRSGTAVLAATLALAGSVDAQTRDGAVAPTVPPAATAPATPTADYRLYVGAESSDQIFRVRFGPQGTVVERTIAVGELQAEMEGPHGLAISRDGRYLHLTTGHGFPDGKYWQYELGPDTLVGPGLLLGTFPASIDVSPDGLYTFSVNFNLHGDMVPSSVSVVYVPTLTEVARIVTCTMPHGSRVSPDGRFQYSGCMMDDQLVEIDTRTLEVSRRFSLKRVTEGPLPADGGEMLAMWVEGARKVSNGETHDPAQVGYLAMEGHRHRMEPQECSPTWAQPAADGTRIYVACNKSDEILEVDHAAWRVTRRLPTGRGPYNLAVTPDGALLVATLKQGAGVELFDLASGASLARIPTSNRVAHGVAISPDSRYAFVSSEGVGAESGKVDVIDLRARAKVGTAEVGQQAGGIAFWRMEPGAP
jgi:hypothetical protein